MSDLVRALVDGDPIKNAINNAVIRSLFQCRKAGIAFTGELAKAAPSDKIRIDAAVRQASRPSHRQRLHRADASVQHDERLADPRRREG